MDRGQAPWRALTRATRFQGPSSQGHCATPSCVASSTSPRRYGRRHGWRRHRDDVRVDESVEQNLERRGYEVSPRGRVEDQYWYEELEFDDDDIGEWWTPIMPSRAFLREGLIHMSVPYFEHAYCGVECVPYGVRLYSTDAAREYALMLSVLETEVNCLECFVRMCAVDERDRWSHW